MGHECIVMQAAFIYSILLRSNRSLSNDAHCSKYKSKGWAVNFQLWHGRGRLGTLHGWEMTLALISCLFYCMCCFGYFSLPWHFCSFSSFSAALQGERTSTWRCISDSGNPYLLLQEQCMSIYSFWRTPLSLLPCWSCVWRRGEKVPEDCKPWLLQQLLLPSEGCLYPAWGSAPDVWGAGCRWRWGKHN